LISVSFSLVLLVFQAAFACLIAIYHLFSLLSIYSLFQYNVRLRGG